MDLRPAGIRRDRFSLFPAFGRTHPMIGQTVPGTLAVTHCCLTCYALTPDGTQVALLQHAGCHTSLRSRVGHWLATCRPLVGHWLIGRVLAYHVSTASVYS